CFMVRADLYHKVGGLDNDLYAHMEEVDLCWRMKNTGYKIGYIARSLVYHVGGSVISYGSPQKLYYNFRNNLVLLIKNEKGKKLITVRNEEGIYRRSIVWDYFLLRRKKFTDLRWAPKKLD